MNFRAGAQMRKVLFALRSASRWIGPAKRAACGRAIVVTGNRDHKAVPCRNGQISAVCRTDCMRGLCSPDCV